MTLKRNLALGWLALVVILLAGGPVDRAAAQNKPEGEMRWALYVTLSPVWFDPGEVVGQITPFWVLYALHDALVKPMPGNQMTPSLAESWTVSPDQRAYEFKLREGLKFHNGDPFTAEDVKFSFMRAKGSKILHDRVKEVVVVSPSRVRFVLHEPFPDFMAFYGTMATGAGWIVPKSYIEKVGDDGFKKHPVGLGPYKFVSHNPGIELVMEANENYWRKMPSVKRLVYKVVPESTTRMAMLKRGEVDIAYLLEVPQAQELKRDPTVKLAFSGGIAVFFLDFLDQWDPKSPWADKRVRLAASYALDRQALSDAETLGASKPAGNFIPRAFDFALPIEPLPHNPARAKQLLTEAGYPNGFDARRALSASAVLLAGRGDHRQSAVGRHQAEDAADGARRVLRDDSVEEGPGRLRVLERALRQRRLADVRDLPERGRLRLRWLSRHRRALPAAGARDRSQEARGASAPDPADHERAHAHRADLRVHLAQRDRAARRESVAHGDHALSLVGAARGRPVEEELTALVIQIQQKLEADVAKPILGWRFGYFVQWPHVKNLVPHHVIYNYAPMREVCLDK